MSAPIWAVDDEHGPDAAIEALDRSLLGELDPADAAELRYVRVTLLDDADRTDEAVAAVADAIEAAERAGTPWWAARAASLGANVAVRQDDLGTAIDLGVTAILALDAEDIPPLHRAAAHSNLGYVLGADGAGLAQYEAALELLVVHDRTTGDTSPGRHIVRQNVNSVLRARAQRTLGPERHAILRRIEDLARTILAADDVPGLLRVIAGLDLAELLAEVGRTAESEALLDDVLRAEAAAHPRAEAVAQRTRAVLLQARGDHHGCLDAVAAALDTGLFDGSDLADLRSVEARSLNAVGRHTEAIEAMAEALRIERKARSDSVERIAGLLFQRVAVERERRALARDAEALRVANERDPLTGLGNRRRFDRVVRQVGGAPCAVLVCDLDHFKRVNDTFGHGTGDAVLVRAARLLQGVLRGGDELVRWGGEEFVVVLAGADQRVAAEVAERCRAAVAGASWSDLLTDGAPQTVSIGGAVGRGADVEALLEEADRALYAAKTGGRNRVVVADDPDPSDRHA